MADLSVAVRKTINAPVERVFNAWLNPQTLSKFMVPAPGMPEPRTEVDAREGGRFAVYMLVGDQEIPHRGTYLEIRKPSKLVFSWESPFSTEGSTVSIQFTALSDERTEVELVHLKFKDEEARKDHEGGWKRILDVLAEVCGAVPITA